MNQPLSGPYFYYRVSGFHVETGKPSHRHHHLSIKSGGRGRVRAGTVRLEGDETALGPVGECLAQSLRETEQM